MTVALCLASFAVGVVCHRSYSRDQVVKTKSAARQLAFEIRNPLDLCLNHLSGSWEARV